VAKQLSLKKMGYFISIADQSFKVGPEGEHLFYLGGPWSRPIVLESEEQRELIYSKHLWMQRIFLTLLILGQPFLFSAFPEIKGKLLGFLGYFVIIMIINWIAQRVIFRRELNHCRRSARRLSFQDFYQQMANRHSETGLSLGVLGSLAFAICGLWIEFGAESAPTGIGLFCAAFFGACGVAWAYALRLKRRKPPSSEQGAAGQPATRSESK
jgi:hypothetical protein